MAARDGGLGSHGTSLTQLTLASPSDASVFRFLMPSSPALVSTWTAEPAPEPPLKDNRLSPLAVDKHWQALGQSWNSGGTQEGFNPGWARIQWTNAALYYDIILLGSRPRNRAVKLNERTWELGDVAEIFLHTPDLQRYIEVHITPENQRLQLVWPAGGLDRVRQNMASLEEFTVEAPDWIQSSTHLGPGFWVSHVVIPFSTLGLNLQNEKPSLQTAVCRYDYSLASAPVLSSTAPLHEPDYHRVNEWQKLTLAAERG